MKITEQQFWEFVGKLLLMGMIASVCGLALQEHAINLLEVENRNLTQDNTSLEIDLKDAQNEIYKLNLDLSKTEKTLAETAQKLQEAEATQEEQEGMILKYVGEYDCTAYCTENYSHICGGGGKTASGVHVTPDVSVATTDLKTFPYGTIIYIEDVGIRIVQDTGGFSKNKLDIAVKTHEEATHWKGQGKHRVWIIEIKENKE